MSQKCRKNRIMLFLLTATALEIRILQLIVGSIHLIATVTAAMPDNTASL